MQAQIDRMRTEIESRVEWGDDPSTIRKWFSQQDTVVEKRQLEQILTHAMKRKAGQMTTGGITRLSIAAILLIPGIIVCMTFVPELTQDLSRSSLVMCLLGVAAMIIGGWLGLRGLDQLLNGISKTGEAISDHPPVMEKNSVVEEESTLYGSKQI